MLRVRPIISARQWYSTRIVQSCYQQAKYSTSQLLKPKEKEIRYKRNDLIQGFRVKDVTEVEELHMSCIRLQHLKTGADYLHVVRNDSNNVFSVAFRTPPTDSSGVCHILEHLALCGSQTYPCRDPFFKMLNRSVATFMNAFTGSDYTMYPFSTQNPKDFNNLMHVYLDAAFFPLLLKRDFNQEGWRLEHESVEDPTTPIILKGVVLNEMKAMHASSAYMFHEHLLNKMLPSHAYKYISGGDPQEIPNLTWEQLKKFHSTFYHPSNARFYSYGNFPLESHLINLDNWILSRFEQQEVNSTIPTEERWTKSRETKFKCFPDPVAPNPDKLNTFAQAYLLDTITNTYESFTHSILGLLLMDGASSPFYKNLLLPGIGADYSPGSGYNNFNKQSFFSIGLTGIAESDIPKVASTIEETFDQVIKEGFPAEHIEAVLHSIELGLKHQTSNFGLSVGLALNSIWNHGGDPTEGLQINRHIKWFRDQLAKDPSYLQNKVLQYFKLNNHKLLLTMNPDVTCSDEFAKKEKEVLQKKLESLTNEEKESIFKDGMELAKYQRESSKSINLPTLLPSELDPKIEQSVVRISKMGSVPVYATCSATNGVAYFRSILNTAHLSDELRTYLPLFCNVLTKMGAGKLDFMEQDLKTTLHTGGLSASVHISQHPNNVVEEGILLSSYCLNKNTEQMFGLWQDIFNKLSFKDQERFAQLVLADASDLVQNLPHIAHSYAMRYANSSLNTVGALSELHGGLTHVSHQKELATLENFTNVIEKLREISSLVLNTGAMRCAIHTTEEFENEFNNHFNTFLSSLPSRTSSSHSLSNIVCKPHKTHFVMPFPVNYVAKGQSTVSYSHHDFATLRVMAQLGSSKYLHREIREAGGAYGSGISLNNSGMWTYYSYRDPNVENTLKAFSQSTDFLANGNFTEQDVEEAKLQVLSEMDKPVPPGSKGLLQFLNGIDDNLRQQYRDNVFLVTKTLIQEKANEHLNGNSQFGITVLGPDNQFTTKSKWNIIPEM